MAFIKPFSRSHRPNDPGYAFDVPAHWKDISPTSRLGFYAMAISEMGNPVLFSLHLTEPTRRQMERSKSKPKDLITQRFRNYLPNVPFFVVLEHTDNDKLHLHGGVSAPDVAPHDLEARLKKVAGDRRKLASKEERAFYDRWALRVRSPDQGKNWGGRNGIYG